MATRSSRIGVSSRIQAGIERPYTLIRAGFGQPCAKPAKGGYIQPPVRQPVVQPLLENRLDIHDQKQFELKVEYQPSGTDPDSKYSIDAWLFLPGSLNIDQDTYPRADFYADLHNYVRLKTPVLSFDEILTG